MKCIHRHGFFYLFDDHGKPLVKKRLVSESRVGTDLKTCIVEESGDLDGKHLTPAAKVVLSQAWTEYVEWKAAMA